MKPSKRIADVEISLIRQMAAMATPSTFNVGIGEPNVEPDEEFREMARRVASEGSWHYSANAGTLRLRELISERFTPAADPASSVCVTAGTEEALYSIFQGFVSPGDEVLVPDPGFSAYPTLARLAGGASIPYVVETETWQPDLEDIESKITPRTRLMIVNSPSNPTGGVIRKDLLERLVGLAEKHDFLMVADEVYGELYFEERPGSVAGRSKNVAVVNGMSKSHAMTGLRLGWALADPEVMKTILKAHQYIATCASTFAQGLAESILSSPAWNERWLRQTRAQFMRQRDVAVEAVREHLQIPLQIPGGAFYLFIPVPVCDSLAFTRQLIDEASVLTIPGIAFGARGEGFIRISYAAPEDVILESIARIGKFVSRMEQPLTT